MSVWERFPGLLLPPVKIWVEIPMASENAHHASQTEGSHPPIIVRRCVTDPRMQSLLEQIVRKCGVLYGLERNVVSLPKGKCGPLTSGRVSREVHI